MQRPQWLDTTIENVKQTYRSFPEVFIFAFISIGVIFFARYIISRNDTDVNNIKCHQFKADSTIARTMSTSARLDSINLCKNLKAIYMYINEVKQSKIYLASKYQQFLILCFSIGIFFVTLTAVIAFVVTKKGWDTSSRKRKGLLLSCAFYGLLLTAFPKLFDQDQNYRTNYSDYDALSNTQIFIFKRLSPYVDKKTNILDSKDSLVLLNTMDTATASIIKHTNIDISLDKKQLDPKKFEF